MAGNIPIIIWKLATLHVDQVNHHTIGALDLKRHSNGAFNEVARIRFVIRKTVHVCPSLSGLGLVRITTMRYIFPSVCIATTLRLTTVKIKPRPRAGAC